MINRLARLAMMLSALWILIPGCASKSEERSTGPRPYPLPAAPQSQPSDAWPMSPDKAEYLFTKGELRWTSREGAGAGVTGASRLMLFAPEYDLEFKAKWKEVPLFLESWNNSPRRELAAYDVQKLFLDPQDYVVPTTAIRCVELDKYRQHFPRADATFKDTNCVLGTYALWINNVTIDKEMLDSERFARDPNYAYHLSNFNILTVLIDHKDGRTGNFLVSKNEADRHVFAIDNGISFDAWIWNWFVPNWNEIRVPAVNRKAVDRLRQVKSEQIHRLATVAELRVDNQGIYQPVEPTHCLDPDKGARTAPGIVQFGLTTDEIDDVHEKIEEILEMVDDGELPVF